MIYKRYFKRIIDIVISFFGLLILLPIIFVITISLWIANKGNGVFFKQERPGYKGNLFKVVKFKTMNDKRDENGKLLPDSIRLTKIGKFMRSTSFDELPQLWNVLKGDMSLVGPRPLLIIYLPLYSSYHAQRHDVKPGITGWAQVNGRNLLLLSKKFDYDVWYTQNVSFSLDIRIIALTIVKIFQRKDIGLGACEMKDVDDLGFLDKINMLNNFTGKNELKVN